MLGQADDVEEVGAGEEVLGQKQAGGDQQRDLQAFH
jgi:hypothetical protein